MNLTPVYRAALLAFALLAGLTVPMLAQSVLLTDYKGKLMPVISAKGIRPIVEAGGKRVVADGRRYGLQKVEEYLPVFISLRNLDVRTHHLELNGNDMNYEFEIRSSLETPYALEDVFVVLELDTDFAGKVLFLHDIGSLEPNKPTLLFARVPLRSGLGASKYQIHLFSRGHEVLHSKIDAMRREAVVDRMTKKRIASVKEAAPTLLIGPQPEYPAALRKSNISGKTMISLRIGANGRVYDPVLKSASDPAFGESALTAVRMWRFLPQVKNGRPIETQAELPINFDPPLEMPKKS